MKQARQLCKEMIIGLILWLIPVLLILTIIAPNHLAMAAGVLTGGAVAAGLLWHMYRHLDIALDMDAKHCPVTYTVCSIQKNVFCRSDHGSSISLAAVCASDRCGIWNYGAEDYGTYVSEASSCYSKVQEKETVVIRFLYHHNISVFHRKNKSKGR